MRFLVKLIPVFLFLGCQTSLKNPCAAQRFPAEQNQCAVTVQKVPEIKTPMLDEIQKFFQGLEMFGTDEGQLAHNIGRNYLDKSSFVSSTRSTDGTLDLRRYLKSTSVGEVLLERRKLNESTAKILTEFGYRESAGRLLPPRNLAKLYAQIYQKLAESARENGVSENDILWPAFMFSRYDSNEKKDVQIFVRPGFDPIPDKAEKWELSSSGDELELPLFHRMIKERRFLLNHAVFFHDIGHVVDFIERPHYMVAYRRYLEKKSEFEAAVVPALRPHVQGMVAIRGDIERYMNEWLFLPSQKNVQKIAELLPDFEIKKRVKLSSLQKKYELHKPSDNLRLAKKFLKNRYVLFSSHGGGARDWSYERYLRPDYIITGFEEILKSEGAAVNAEGTGFQQAKDPAFRIFEAPGIFQRLEYLVSLKEKREIPLEVLDGLQKQQAKNPSLSFEDFIDKQISYHLAETQYRVQMGLHFAITPEQIATDMALLYENKGFEKYQKTATYQYYSTYRPRTVQWYLGYDLARPSPDHPYTEP